MRTAPFKKPAMIVLAVAMLFGCARKNTDDEVEGMAVRFKDPDLERAVRAELGRPKGTVAAEQLAGITSLEAPGAGIADLAGLQYCTGLTLIDLSGNRIVDISPLSGLGKLATLRLAENRIQDVSPLVGLVQLVELDLSGNDLAGAKPLFGLSRVASLNLSDNALVEVSFTSHLLELTELNLANNALTDIAPLVKNAGRGGLGEGDVVDLTGNPLGEDAMAAIESLRATGVEVRY